MASDAQGLSTKKILTTKNPFIKPNSPRRSFDFLLRDTNWDVSEKFDGVKVYAWRRNSEWDSENWAKNWVFSYKGFILFPEEYEYLLNNEDAQEQVKKESKASSQYVFFLKHFKDTHEADGFSDEVKSNEGTLYFMEYIMKKATLALEYEDNYKMFLIAYFPNVSPDVKGDGSILFGVDEGSGKTSNREEVAEGLGLDDKIETIYSGTFADETTISAGIVSEELQASFAQHLQGKYDGADDYVKVNLLNNMFLNMKSSIGGLSEGVVLIGDSSDKAYAFNREREPVTKEMKAQIGALRSQNEESVLAAVNVIMDEVNKEFDDFYNKEEILKWVSTKLYGGDFDSILEKMPYKEIGYRGKVDEASIFNKRDMVYLRFKMNYLSDVKYGGNELALVPGKFRIFTNGHDRMVQTASDLVGGDKNVIVGMVGKQNVPKRLRLKMINTARPDVHVIELKDANLKNILDINKLKGKVKYIVSGTDRESGYAKQVDILNQQGYNLQYVEVPRADTGEGSESATETEQMIRDDDLEGFKKVTPYGKRAEEIFNDLKGSLKIQEHLLEGSENSVEGIKSLVDSGEKVYILYGGGIGSGKSHHAADNFSDMKIIDSDEIAMRNAGDTPPDQIPPSIYSAALKEKQREVAEALQGAESFIEMGTSSNEEAAIKKIEAAKANGFKTAFIFVDVPLQVSIDRNRERIQKGGRGVPQDKEYKIERTNERARNTAEQMKKLADLYLEVPYSAPIMEGYRRILRSAFFG